MINDWALNIGSRSGNTLTIAGTDYSFSSSAISSKGTHLLATITSSAIAHNSDGTKSISMSCSWNMRANLTIQGTTTYHGTLTASDTITLDTIARASQPSCITWPEHTQNVGSFGDTISIHMNRNSSAFTHTVGYLFGSQSPTTIATGVTNGLTWTIPKSLMTMIPNTTKASGTIYAETYKGSTYVGINACGFTATVPTDSDCYPTCTVAVSDPTGNLTKYGAYVKGLSKLQVTVTPTLAYSSPIKTYSTTANGSKYTSESFTTGVLKSSGTLTVSATVTDGRGRSGTASEDLTVLDYTAPSISKLTVGRCDADGTANEQGDHVQVTFSASVTALNDLNTATYKLRYKKTSADEYTEVTISDLQNNYSVSNYAYVFEADTGSSYNVEVSVTDHHSIGTRSTSASTALTLMHFGEDGTSIGLLKVAERSGAVDIGGDAYTNGHAVYGAHGMFDNRDSNELPQWYMETYGRGVVWEFKELASIGFTAPATKYAPVQTIVPWVDASGGLPRQIAYEGRTRWIRIANNMTAWGAWQSDALIAYPVGSIYIAYNHTDPGTLFGGTWERIENAFLWGCDSTGTIGQTGGEKTHTLTVDELPSHNHGGTYTNAGDATKTHAWLTADGISMAYEHINTGGGQAHNNMPPYIQVSIWRRTA